MSVSRKLCALDCRILDRGNLKNGRSGVSYKAEFSDGNSTVELPTSEEVYRTLKPFVTYEVKIEITQTSYENKKSIRGRIVSASAVN